MTSLSEPRRGELAKSPAGRSGSEGSPKGHDGGTRFFACFLARQESRSPPEGETIVVTNLEGVTQPALHNLSHRHRHEPPLAGFRPGGRLTFLLVQESKQRSTAHDCVAYRRYPIAKRRRRRASPTRPLGLRQRSPFFRPRRLSIGAIEGAADRAILAGFVARPTEATRGSMLARNVTSPSGAPQSLCRAESPE